MTAEVVTNEILREVIFLFFYFLGFTYPAYTLLTSCNLTNAALPS